MTVGPYQHVGPYCFLLPLINTGIIIYLKNFRVDNGPLFKSGMRGYLVNTGRWT